MKVTTFTDTMIRKLKPTEKKYLRAEGNGFSVRVMPSGLKTWLYVYTFDSKRREMNLGSYPDVSLETARGRFEEARKKVKNGINPVAEMEEAAEERRKAPTVADLCAEYIERHAKKFKRSWATDERILNHDIIPAWGKRKAADIKKRDVVLILEKIVDRGAPSMANNTFAVIRKMFAWAVEKDILTTTPCFGVKMPAPKVSRERVLSESEIRTFWQSLDSCGMSVNSRNALRLILLTAQRPGEVIRMHTSEINGEWWTIPAERSKNKKSHRVHLSHLAREILGDAVESAAGGASDKEGYQGFVFPSRLGGGAKSIAPMALVKAVGKNLAWPVIDAKGEPLLDAEGKPVTVNRIGIDHFTPHDLRRTAATCMAESGEMDEVIDAVLNHAKQGIIRVYNQFKYDNQKKAALDAWARKLSAIIGGTKSNVIPFQRKS
ncbi:integrase arm-type DNA-binding domain-containing protein [Geomonas nitrogeniifigens]|uniref:Integrase arm-type DNA-binding domain-containing protein n=1 Tax=Geomonas diazotrophica TaxID=2843197 RepID=A0ABX8JTQ3_9BACT|nr:integrase arm-type DNA-binding domain-containing protein [Geomonas nitrogeniifigens]QWV98805.1 integrase arm-type DNA-binding domain-containing protein [Geomonas nitrogeniifigens]